MTDRHQPVGGGHTRTGRSRPSSESTDPPSRVDGEVGDGAGLPTPAWVPTDDVIDSTPDRQVLVVGDTPTGVALTRLLRRAGFDPVVASHAGPTAVSRVTLLSPAATEVLGTLGEGRRLLARGATVDSISVVTTRGDGRNSGTVGPRSAGTRRVPAVAVPTPVLYRTLNDGLPGDVSARDRTVESVSPAADGVAVRFDDGVREWFDVVVDAGTGQRRSGGRSDAGTGQRRSGGRSDADAGQRRSGEWSDADAGQRRSGEWSDAGAGRHDVVHQYEATVDGPSGTRTCDVWLPNGILQCLPAATDGGTLVRITVAASESPADERVIEAATRQSDAFEGPAPEAFDRERVRQVRLPGGTVAERRWGDGRIARCGRAACPAAPATGVGVSLGITDALGLVSVLARDGRAVAETTAAYAADRAKRFAALERAATGADHPVPAAEPLRSLGVVRAMALEALVAAPRSALWSGSRD
ncbi:hypothetical protein GCM10008995_11790 [Halobellus salinus]|uniref:FAD-binding domain-containing protein n=1 Tax=Halobellus salinus TaxID=931585 RepID=A0A830EEX6_9EURY|nr:FAD-dependent monooxygenase [Halobellus salinus]GGJ03639.1 hypothetical protein GCM10008995_11790 [Halobellus salinus]SMP21119.1 2-polyprenyl-6-methoxyphenol hydroxylase [Halobellus salinus]